MMEGSPGFGRGMTVDFSDEISVPAYQRASGRSQVSQSNQTQRATSTSERSNMELTATLGPECWLKEQGQLILDAREGPASLFQEVQRRQQLQVYQKQLQQVVAAGQPPPNQFDSSRRQRRPSVPPADGEKQWFIHFDQQQQQQQQQQQPYTPPHVSHAAMAATPPQLQPNHQQAPVPQREVSPQQRRSPQVQILKRSPQPTQSTCPPYHQGQRSLQQMQQQQQQFSPPLQEPQQQRQDETRPQAQQQAFPPPFLPPSASPTLIDPISLLLIDTSKPPPPIGVPLPRIPFPPPGPPHVNFSPPNDTTQPPLRQASIPQLPSQAHAYPLPNTLPTSAFRHHPERSMGSDGSAFAAVSDSMWDNIPLGGGYAPLDSSVKRSPKAFLPRASDLLSQPDQHQPKGSTNQKRDGAQSQQRPWTRKDKAKGRGMTKKDGQSVGLSPASKPGGAHGAPVPVKQPQEMPQALSQEQAKNEYEWQSFKIVRKVRKVLGGVKDEQGAAEAAAEINNIMKAESGRLASFPWPKEQFVALDEILGWAMERPEKVETVCQLIQMLHGQHPDNFAEDLTNTLMKRHKQCIKVSTATNKEKLYATFSGLVASMFVLSRSAKNDFREIGKKLLDMTVNKWIMCDMQGTLDDPTILADVYAYCLRALFIIIGPQLDGQQDQKYNKLLRDQVLGDQPRYVKEAMLDLLLLRAVGWKGSLEFKTESATDSKRETAGDSDSRPIADKSPNRLDGENVPGNSPQDGQTHSMDSIAEGSNSVGGGGDASACVPSGVLAADATVTAAKESPSQPASSNACTMDKGETQSPSLARDIFIPAQNISCTAQTASDHPDASAGDAQVERSSFGVDDGSATKFKLPDRETAERGAFVLGQNPFQVPYIAASPAGNISTASLHIAAHQFAPGVSAAGLNSWAPVYITRPEEAKASRTQSSPSRPTLAKAGQPAPTSGSTGHGTTRHSTSEMVSKASVGSRGDPSSAPSPSSPVSTTTGPSNQSSSQVGLAASSAKQSTSPDTKPQPKGAWSQQLSANNNNCSGNSYNLGGHENNADEEYARLQSSKELTLPGRADFLTNADKRAIYEIADAHQQLDKGQKGIGYTCTGLPWQRENFWEEESDSTSSVEQLPPASCGDYGPPEVFQPHRELSGQQEVDGLPTSTDQGALSGPFPRQLDNGSPSHLPVPGGSSRSGPNVFGRGMMRLQQGSGMASPAAGLMTSPLAFIQATTGPVRSAARNDGDRQVMEATVDQTRNVAEAEKSRAPNQNCVSFQLNDDPGSGLGHATGVESPQRNKVEDSTQAPQTRSGDENTCSPSKVTVVDLSVGLQGNNIQDTHQLTLDVATDYFGDKVSHIPEVFRKTAFRAPELVPEETNPTLDGKGNSTLEDNPGITEDDLGKGGQGATNKGVMVDPVRGVTTPTSPVIRKEVKLLGAGSPASEPAKQLVNCPLCGSDKHRTRQCDMFKMYAPRARTSTVEPEPEPAIPVVPKAQTASKFGQTIFCSKCGQKGHLTYDCPVGGSFNIFKQFQSL